MPEDRQAKQRSALDPELAQGDEQQTQLSQDESERDDSDAIFSRLHSDLPKFDCKHQIIRVNAIPATPRGRLEYRWKHRIPRPRLELSHATPVIPATTPSQFSVSGLLYRYTDGYIGDVTISSYSVSSCPVADK
jgi:hypothetical protein